MKLKMIIMKFCFLVLYRIVQMMLANVVAKCKLANNLLEPFDHFSADWVKKWPEQIQLIGKLGKLRTALLSSMSTH